MNIFDRLISGLKSLFGRAVYSPEDNLQLKAKTYIAQQRQSQKRLKDSMTDLIFQRKKFEKQLKVLENRKLNFKTDIEEAALQDRDDLAMRLMEELDQLVKEIAETESNLSLVAKEIQTAKHVEVELARQVEKSESQLAILAARSESVKMREDLQSQFSKIHQEIDHIKPGLSEIEESILHLESRLENISAPQEDWKNEVVKMRKNRTDHIRLARLEQLKMQLKNKSLPSRVLTAEVVTH